MIKKSPRHLGSTGVSKFAYLFLTVMSLVFIFPMYTALMVSVTSQDSIRQYGFQLWPSEFSLEAYELLLRYYGKSLGRAFFLTVGTGMVQPILCIFLVVCMAYPLSQSDFKGRNFWRIYVLFTMLFSGGLIPTYILYTKYLKLKNTVWIYILPCCEAWSVFVFRTFFANIDKSMVESAKIDGASNFRILSKIMLPLTKPLIAMNFFSGFLGRWNDIHTPLYYINKVELYTVQYLLQQMLTSAEKTRELLEMGFAVDVAYLNVPVEAVRYTLAVVGALPVIIIFPYIQKYYAKGIMLGSTKG